MRRLAFYVIVIAATLALLILLWQFRSVVILLILSLVLTAALRPSVESLKERGLNTGLARLLVYLLVFGTLGLGIYLLSGPLLAELRLLSNYLIVLYDNTYNTWADGTGLQQSLIIRFPAPGELGEALTDPAGVSILQLVFGVTQNAVTVVAGLVVIIAVSLYWSADRGHFERLWLSLLPAGRRIQARAIWQDTETSTGNYVRSEAIQAFLAFVMLALGYRIIGLDYPLLMALVAGIAWLIPLAGFIIAALAAFLLGMASAGGLLIAVGALILTVAVLLFLEFVVEPRLFQRNQFSGVLTILVIILMVEAYGLIGFIIGPPLAVAIQVMGGHMIRAGRRPVTTTVQVDTLEQRLTDVRALYTGAESANGEPIVMPPEVASLVGRLENLIGEARKVSIEEQAAP